MGTEQTNNRKPDPQSKTAVRQMLDAMDRVIAAAKQAERARNQLMGDKREGRRR